MGLLLDMLYRIPALIIAVVLHEYVKATASWRLGDNQPKLNGRITLNPMKHIDLFGAICILFTGFGWGRPVFTSPMFYGNRKKATIVVYALPSIVNLVVGMIAAVLAHFVGLITFMPYIAQNIVNGLIFQIAFVNIAMALFNIIPIYPLDGARVLAVFLNPQARVKIASYEKAMQIFLILFILIGFAQIIFGPLVYSIIGFVEGLQ